MENNELLNMLSQLFDEKLEPIKQDIKELKQQQLDTRKDITEIRKDIVETRKDIAEIREDIVEVRKDIVEVKDIFMNLESVNGNRHLEILTEVKDLKEKFYRVEKDVNKVEVVTGKNCIEIEYLKAVK